MRYTFVALSAALLFACNEAQQPHASPNSLLAPAPSGAGACTPADGQTELVSKLSRGGVHLTAMAASTMQPLFDASVVACWFSTSDKSFEALFFKDPSSASAFKVCETVSGQRYLYRMNIASTTVDSVHRLFWTRSSSVVLISSDASFDAKLRSVLGGTAPGC